MAQFISHLTFTDLPQTAITTASTGFVDCTGVMLAGADEPVVGKVISAIGHCAGEAPVLFSQHTMHPAHAAWINGVAAHALDWDDAALRGHPSAVLVPTILAEAHVLGRSGADAITAFVAGYETWAELAHRDAESHHRKGWHPTGIFGAIASAAACASLYNLDPERAAHALAIAASRSSGLMSNFGSMTKPIHAGNAAHAGIIAARLAAAGTTGSHNTLEDPQGFLSAVSPSGKVDKRTPVHARRDWHIEEYGLNIKQYPMCYCTHRPIDAMIALQKKHGWDPNQIRNIDVSISGRNATVLRNHWPQTGLEAKFSIEFAMASAVVAQRVGLAQVNDDFVQTDIIQDLMHRVSVTINPAEDAESGYAPYDHVVVTLAGGETVKSDEVHEARGARSVPLTKGELREKFEECARAGGIRDDIAGLFEFLSSLDRQAELMPLRKWQRHQVIVLASNWNPNV
ncbi:MmgE/PrpD family protein [Pusillimonas soli]|uniref:MmgE/PrpD family protein n=1 Tax=Allopusillimonas soli TaxID=659016 RepID=A0A853FER1_9BURK|nr:MmgE/PrpD family protein [Allopusillimonas soli]